MYPFYVVIVFIFLFNIYFYSILEFLKMPRVCIVPGCSNARQCTKFFRVPKIDSTNESTRQLQEQRRNLWLENIKTDIKKIPDRPCVCSAHFVSGKIALIFFLKVLLIDVINMHDAKVKRTT